MSVESETKKLLEYREALENRVKELEAEASDLKLALSKLDKLIVDKGFRTLTPTKESDSNFSISHSEVKAVEEENQLIVEPVHEILEPPEKEIVESHEETGEIIEGSSVTSKDGSVLGKLYVRDKDLTFKPVPQFRFKSDIPPFQSFFLDRVLGNMRENDQERASKGEINIDEILEFHVAEEEGIISEINVSNYGGERRLREITSSLRWTFDKMNDKLQQG
jgi:hypothetical protein